MVSVYRQGHTFQIDYAQEYIRRSVEYSKIIMSFDVKAVVVVVEL